MNAANQTAQVRRECRVREYLAGADWRLLFIQGDAQHVLATFPAGIIDCAMTSPPYWGQRAYSGGGIGQEETWQHYLENLLAIAEQVYRVLKPPVRSG